MKRVKEGYAGKELEQEWLVEMRDGERKRIESKKIEFTWRRSRVSSIVRFDCYPQTNYFMYVNYKKNINLIAFVRTEKMWTFKIL